MKDPCLRQCRSFFAAIAGFAIYGFVIAPCLASEPQPQAGFSVLPRNGAAPWGVGSADGVAPHIAHFDAHRSQAGNPDSVVFRWEFGDGQSDTGMFVTHTYHKAGSYTVNLRIHKKDSPHTILCTAGQTLVVEPSRSAARYAPFNHSLSDSFLSDLRVAVVFDTITLSSERVVNRPIIDTDSNEYKPGDTIPQGTRIPCGIPSWKIGDLQKGVLTGLNAWASVIPGMHVSIVASEAKPPPRMIFSFGDYELQGPRGGRARWVALSSFPTGRGVPQRSIIYLNTRGRNNYAFRPFDFVCRDSVYASYVATTYPPEWYHANCAPGSTNPGHITGRFLHRATERGQWLRSDAQDVAHYIIHEFGHSLGLTHRRTTRQEISQWFNGGRFPRITVDTLHYPDLPFSYAGEGAFTCGKSPRSSYPKTIRLDPTHPLARQRMYGANYDSDHLFARFGLPHPPNGFYNNRVIFAEDIQAMPGALQRDYPHIRGFIELRRRPPSRLRKYTSDWDSAITLMQLDTKEQKDAFYVTAIYPNQTTRPPLMVTIVSNGDKQTLKAARAPATLGSVIRCLGRNPSGHDSLDNPAAQVTAYDAMLYCNALSKANGMDTVYSYLSAQFANETAGLTGQCRALEKLRIDNAQSGFRLPRFDECIAIARALIDSTVSDGADYHWALSNSSLNEWTINPSRSGMGFSSGIMDVGGCGAAQIGVHNTKPVRVSADTAGPRIGFRVIQAIHQPAVK